MILDIMDGKDGGKSGYICVSGLSNWLNSGALYGNGHYRKKSRLDSRVWGKDVVLS